MLSAVVQYSPLPFVHNLRYIKDIEDFDLYSAEQELIRHERDANTRSQSRTLTTSSLGSIFLRQFLIQLADLAIRAGER